MMELDFMDGMNLMALLVATVFAITAWQSRRCSTNVNDFNNTINAILIRQTLLAERLNVELPPVGDVIDEMGCTLPGACTPRKWDTPKKGTDSCER